MTSMPGREQQYINVAKDAITIAKAASDYAKDLDFRLQAGATAHMDVMEAPYSTTPPPTTSASETPEEGRFRAASPWGSHFSARTTCGSANIFPSRADNASSAEQGEPDCHHGGDGSKWMHCGSQLQRLRKRVWDDTSHGR